MLHLLDHASTSPLRPSARTALLAAIDEPWGDPSRVHHAGMAARVALEDARATIAECLDARAREVVLTSGATEAIAAACAGVASRGRHQVVTAVEHSAVRRNAEAHGDVTVVGVDRTGRVDADAVLAAITADTAAVHVQWGNHEVGTLQPVADIVAGCRAAGVLVHVDAAQAVGHVVVSFRELDADLLSVSGHKFGAPLGTGALLIRRGLRIDPLLVGGEQERARRAGIENTPAVVGFAAALVEAAAELDHESARAEQQTARLRAMLTDIDGVELYGHPTHHLPHIVGCGITDIEPQAVLFGLDRRGVAAHAGSACASAELEPSPVLAAMGVDAHRSLRLSVGWSTTDDDIDAACIAVPAVIEELRSLRSA